MIVARRASLGASLFHARMASSFAFFLGYDAQNSANPSPSPAPPNLFPEESDFRGSEVRGREKRGGLTSPLTPPLRVPLEPPKRRGFPPRAPALTLAWRFCSSSAMLLEKITPLLVCECTCCSSPSRRVTVSAERPVSRPISSGRSGEPSRWAKKPRRVDWLMSARRSIQRARASSETARNSMSRSHSSANSLNQGSLSATASPSLPGGMVKGIAGAGA